MEPDTGIQLSRELFGARRRKRAREPARSETAALHAHSEASCGPGSQRSSEQQPFHLHVLSPGSEASEEISFGVKGIRIGRDQSLCDVVLTAACVSRLHCILSVLGSEVCVHDKSFNGTFINGRRIGRGRTCMLSNGDLLSFRNAALADAAELTYRFEGPEPTSAAVVAGLERYTLGPSIGRGSFAVVRLGVHKETNEEVAIKMLEKRSLFADVASASLHSEVELLRGMVHPNIVQVHDAFESDETVVLVMELVRGGDLFDYIVGRGASPFTEDEARFLFLQLLEAALYIHSRGVVHCDLKPENVLVDISGACTPQRADASATTPALTPASSTTGTEERDRTLFSASDSHQEDAKAVSPYHVRLKITDFGVAKYEGEAEESDGANAVTAVGTPAYAAPELVAFTPSKDDESTSPSQTPAPPSLQRYTSALDVWSLGVLLYVLCSGALPRLAQKVEPVRFNRYMTGLSPECKDLIQAMMRIQPEQRITLEGICHHPWLDGATIEGLRLCHDEDVSSNTTAALSPRFGRSARASYRAPHEDEASPN